MKTLLASRALWLRLLTNSQAIQTSKHCFLALNPNILTSKLSLPLLDVTS